AAAHQALQKPVNHLLIEIRCVGGLKLKPAGRRPSWNSPALTPDISVLGPTFKDLAENVNKDISNISYIFVGRSAGYIGGSLVGGVLFDRMSPHLLLGFSMLLTSLGMYAIPFCRQAAVLTAFMSSIGMTMGVLDTGETLLSSTFSGKLPGLFRAFGTTRLWSEE
uniref:Major facilitator superfamily domain containing 4B n=1 Tax=Nothobranchius furzeri TaxID=105023 RepID=A0A8C6P1X0_NOTFU